MSIVLPENSENIYFSLRDKEDCENITGFHSNHKYTETDFKMILHLAELLKHMTLHNNSLK